MQPVLEIDSIKTGWGNLCLLNLGGFTTWILDGCMSLRAMCKAYGCGCRMKGGYGAVRAFGLLSGPMKVPSGFTF